MFLRVNNRIVKIGSRVAKLEEVKELDFEVSGSFFPYGTGSFTRLEISSSILGNEIDINYGDGNTVKYNFQGYRFLISPTRPDRTESEYYYVDGNNGRRVINVKFKYPSKITFVTTSTFSLYGAFPSAIGNLTELERLTIGQSKLTSFPNSLLGLSSLKNIILQNIGTAISERIPQSFFSLKLSHLNINNSVNLNNIYTSNFSAMCASTLGASLQDFKTNGCNISDIPPTVVNMVNLRSWQVGSVDATTISPYFNELTNLRILSIIGNNLRNYTSFSNLIYLIELSISADMEPITPIGLEGCINMKTLSLRGFKTVLSKEAFISDFFGFIVQNASMATGNTKFRQMTVSINNTLDPNNDISGTYQQPAGYVQGSNNGNPATPLEKVWVLVNQYQHTWNY